MPLSLQTPLWITLLLILTTPVPSEPTKLNLLHFYPACISESPVPFVGMVRPLPPYLEFMRSTEPVALASIAS